MNSGYLPGLEPPPPPPDPQLSLFDDAAGTRHGSGPLVEWLLSNMPALPVDGEDNGNVANRVL